MGCSRNCRYGTTKLALLETKRNGSVPYQATNAVPCRCVPTTSDSEAASQGISKGGWKYHAQTKTREPTAEHAEK